MFGSSGRSFGFDLCSTDDSSASGYTVTGAWSPTQGLRAHTGSLFLNFSHFGGRKLIIGSQDVGLFVESF